MEEAEGRKGREEEWEVGRRTRGVRLEGEERVGEGKKETGG